MTYLRNNKYGFKGKNKKEYIPSKLFPLSSKTKVHWFGYPNTTKFDFNKKQKNIINSLEFEQGRCYTNTEKLITNLKGKLDLKFFSGWTFIGNNYPIHHAWGILFKNGNEYVFDMGILEKSEELIEKAKKYNNIEEQRKFYVEEYKKYLKLPNTQKFITGKVIPQNMLYIGVESTKKQAVDCYNKAVGDDPNSHPSYSNMNLDEQGRSKTQRKFSD